MPTASVVSLARRVAFRRAVVAGRVEQLISKRITRRHNIALSNALDEAFRVLSNPTAEIDKKQMDGMIEYYRFSMNATMVDVVVKRVSEVCRKLVGYGFLDRIQLFKSAEKASALERKRFYSQESRLNRKMRLGAWLLMQARGYRSKSGVSPGRYRIKAERLLPRYGGKQGGYPPKLRYGTFKNRHKAVRTATTKFIEREGKSNLNKRLGFLRKAIARGADQMVNNPSGSVKPNPRSEILSGSSSFWSNKKSKAKGVRIGSGKVSGTKDKPYAEVSVPGKIWERAVQPIIQSLFRKDVGEMQEHINKRAEKINRKYKSTGEKIFRKVA